MSNRKRSTWGTPNRSGKLASPPPATPGYAEYWGDDPHPAAQQDPEGDDYLIGDGTPSTFGEDVHMPPYNQSGAPAIPPGDLDHPANKRAAQVQRWAQAKAAKCITIAQGMLGRKASSMAVQKQAFSLMNLPDREIEATLSRMSGGFMADQNDPWGNLASDDMDEDDMLGSELDDMYAGDDMYEDDMFAGDEDDMFGSDDMDEDDMYACGDGGNMAFYAKQLREQRAHIARLETKIAKLVSVVASTGKKASRKGRSAGMTEEQMLAEMFRQAAKKSDDDSDEDDVEADDDSDEDDVEANDDEDEDDKEAGKKGGKKAKMTGEQMLREMLRQAAKKSDDDSDEDDDSSGDKPWEKEDDKEDDKEGGKKGGKKAKMTPAQKAILAHQAALAQFAEEALDVDFGGQYGGADEIEGEIQFDGVDAGEDDEFSAGMFTASDDPMGLGGTRVADADDALLAEIFAGDAGGREAQLRAARLAGDSSSAATLAPPSRAGQGINNVGMPRTASSQTQQRPMPRKKNAGVQSLGQPPSPGGGNAEVSNLSNIWNSSPDVSDYFP